MAFNQLRCAGCKKGFGLSTKRKHYCGMQFHHNGNCLERYKQKHPRTSFRQRLKRLVPGPLKAFEGDSAIPVAGSASGD